MGKKRTNKVDEEFEPMTFLLLLLDHFRSFALFSSLTDNDVSTVRMTSSEISSAEGRKGREKEAREGTNATLH